MIIPKRCIVVDTPSVDLNKLKSAMEKLSFRECGKSQEESWGFFAYDELGESDSVIHTVDRFSVINLRRDHKKLNKTKLSRAWRKELKRQEDAAKMVFDKPKREQIREEVKAKLFQEKEPDETYTKAVYDSITNRLYVLVSIAANAEYFIEKLNLALNDQNESISFKADTLQPELTETLTQWLYQPEQAEENGYLVGEDMMLKGDDSSTATLKNQEANSAEIRELLHSRKLVQKLHLILRNEEEQEISFVIANTRILSQIDLKGICSDQCKAEKENHSDVAALKDAELLIWFSALSDLWDKVKEIPIGE